MTARRVSPETRARRLKVEVERLDGEVGRIIKRLYHDKDGELNVAREAAIRERAARDPESVAIDACVKALDALPPAEQTLTFYTQSSRNQFPDTNRVSRVLDYLHERFIGPKPDVDYLTHELAKAYGRIRDLEHQLDSVRCTLSA